MRTVAFWLSLILIFMIPWEAIVVLPGLGTLTRAIGLFVAAFWVFTVILSGRFRKPDSFHLVIVVFVLWSAASILWTFDAQLTMIRITTYFQLVILVLIIWDLFVTPAALRAGLQAYVLGAYVSIVSLLLNYLTGAEAGAGWGRFTATGFNANNIALILALGLPVAWHLAASPAHTKKAQLLRALNYVYIPLSILAILLTASRGALVACIPAFWFMLGTLTRLKPVSRIFVLALLILGLFGVQTLVPQTSLDRIAAIVDETSTGGFSGRASIWTQGITAFFENPIKGVGSGAYRAAIEAGMAAHNSFLEIAVEVGMIGFVLFGLALVLVVYSAFHQPKSDSGFWVTVVLMWIIGASALSLVHHKPTWLFLSLVIVGANLYLRPAESRGEPEVPVKAPHLSSGELYGA